MVFWKETERNRWVSPHCFPVSKRAHPLYFTKYPVKASLAGKACFRPDFCQGFFGKLHGAAGIIHAEVVQVLGKANVKFFGKYMGKIIFIDMERFGQELQG